MIFSCKLGRRPRVEVATIAELDSYLDSSPRLAPSVEWRSAQGLRPSVKIQDSATLSPCWTWGSATLNALTSTSTVNRSDGATTRTSPRSTRPSSMTAAVKPKTVDVARHASPSGKPARPLVSSSPPKANARQTSPGSSPPTKTTDSPVGKRSARITISGRVVISDGRGHPSWYAGHSLSRASTAILANGTMKVSRNLQTTARGFFDRFTGGMSECLTAKIRTRRRSTNLANGSSDCI